jgi:hypothetical protein
MRPLGCIILVIVVILPIAWAVSEITAARWLRLTLGVAAILSSFGVAFLAGTLQIMNSNVYFGRATKELIDTTITELEHGNTEDVVTSLKQLQQQYRPNYENRANYDDLVHQTVLQMKSSSASRPAPP